MRALLFERNLPKYAAAAVAGRLRPGAGAKVGPLALKDVDPPELPGAGWVRVRPLLSGICGSDLATIDGHSSRYFEPIVSFPFVPGHEVVGRRDDTDERVALAATLTCAARGVEPLCEHCARGATNLCERQAFGHLSPGLQTGFCEDTGGGWSTGFVAHDSQLHAVPEAMSDEDAVLVEPTACAVHAAGLTTADRVAVIGSGTVGLCTIAAIRHVLDPDGWLLAAAKHPHQQRLASELGADTVVEPAGLERAVRAAAGSLRTGAQLTGGADAVYDCIGSPDSLAQALRIVRPSGTVVVVGMPGHTSLDLTGLWHREVALKGSYAYTRDDFDAAIPLVAQAKLGQLVSALYPLDRFRDAIEHAANAGRRGAVKIAFDLRQERQ